MSSGLEIQFYHLQSSPLEKALPKLLEKAYGRGLRCLVKTADAAQSTQLSDKIWTHDPASFLPHGTAQEKHADQQPILFSYTLDNHNISSVCFVTDGTFLSDAPSGISKVLDMFHGADMEAVQAARARWKRYKDAGYALTYYQQTDQGSWQKKA